MTDKTDAWMPLWIGAYLADTQKLTTQQHGAYLLLLMAYWRERKALPDDNEDLRAIVKADRIEWKKLRPKVAVFFKVDDGVWWHKRVEAEIASADKRKAGAVGKAKAAALARWGQANADAPSIPQALPEDCPTPSPLSSKEKSERKRPPPFDASRIEIPDWLDRELWAEWCADRKERGKAITERGVKQQLATLDEFRRAGHTPERTIRHAISSGNQGLFPPPKLNGTQVTAITTAAIGKPFEAESIATQTPEQHAATAASLRAARARVTGQAA